MKKALFTWIKSILTLLLLIGCSSLHAQNKNRIDWAYDTLSKADAMGAKNTYLNVIRGSGQNATEQINLPVGKLKEIMDACAANNVTDVAVMFAAIRQNDVARFKRNNPAASDDQLRGSQVLILRVPRRAFAGAAASKNSSLKTNPLMVSLLSAGLMQVNESVIFPAGVSGDIYFSFGSICPPPASCD